jgi:hypothetical protein
MSDGEADRCIDKYTLYVLQMTHGKSRVGEGMVIVQNLLYSTLLPACRIASTSWSVNGSTSKMFM